VNKIPISSVNLSTIGGVSAELPSIQAGRCSLIAGDANSAAIGTIEGISYTVADTESAQDSIPLAGEQLGTGQLTTSHAFAQRYPKLTQAMVDAVLQGLLFNQANSNDANAIYKVLPAAMTDTLSLGAFTQTLQIAGPTFSNPSVTSGEFPVQMLNDTYILNEGIKVLVAGASLNPSEAFSNKYAVQGYKDLKRGPPTTLAAGPIKIPATVGKPSLVAAKAFAVLTGQPVPANTGAVRLGQVSGKTATTTSS
jgi:hypothetical protein